MKKKVGDNANEYTNQNFDMVKQFKILKSLQMNLISYKRHAILKWIWKLSSLLIVIEKMLTVGKQRYIEIKIVLNIKIQIEVVFTCLILIYNVDLTYNF